MTAFYYNTPLYTNVEKNINDDSFYIGDLGPILWRCLAQNSVLTAPSKARISMGLGRI